MNAVYKVFLPTEFIIAVPVFILLMFISAPYGKFKSSSWGPVIHPSAGWLLMESPAVLLPLFFFLRSERITDLYFIICIIIWETHYIQRTLIYPFKLSKGSHPMPVLIVLFAVLFNIMNGTVNGFGVFISGRPVDISESIFRISAGIVIFFFGFILNLYSDHILRNLRAPGESGYKIPRKGPFKLVCNPNYLGEIIEWIGWTILTLSPAAAAFLVFTVANLVPRAIANLKWYRETFPDFPANRKAVIPWIL